MKANLNMYSLFRLIDNYVNMKFVVLILFLIPSSTFAQLSAWTVTKVVDGDTFYAVREGSKKKFRLIGIDTPEFSHFGRPEEPYAQEATDFLSDRILYNTVLLEEDVQPLDKYKRNLVYVYMTDSTFVNAELVEKGWATTMTIPPNVTHAELFTKLQAKARKEELGIWMIPSTSKR